MELNKVVQILMNKPANNLSKVFLNVQSESYEVYRKIKNSGTSV